MASSQGIRQWGRTSGSVGSQGLPWLTCFLRWADHEGTAMECRESSPGKVEVQCRECGAPFVKYAYEKTVRCLNCRAARRCGSRRSDK
jgi:hypothetical protein